MKETKGADRVNQTLSTPKLALRLWQSHLMMIVLGFIAFVSNDLIETNKVITAIATAFFVGIYWILCYNEANRCGKNDANQKCDGGKMKGLLAGLLATVPAVLVWMISLYLPIPEFLSFFPTFPDDWYRVYMVVYEGLLSFTGAGTMMKLLILLPLPVMSFLGYCTGRKKKNLLENVESGIQKMVYEKKK